MRLKIFKEKLKELYEGNSNKANNFRYALLCVDVITIIFIVVSTFFYGSSLTEKLDIIFGLYLAIDYFSRLWISRKKLAFTLNPLNLADMVAMISFIIPLLGQNFAFLRSLRVLRILRSYHLVNSLRKDFSYFRRHEDIIMSATNLGIFIFMMTELVFVTQVTNNPNVTNFLDAMYFTIAALTTTGFGDVTLQGQSGRALSIVIMIFGVSLFLRLVQTIFRPAKVRFTCEDCGLFLHESDSVHCKHCGNVLNIPSDGDV